MGASSGYSSKNKNSKKKIYENNYIGDGSENRNLNYNEKIKRDLKIILFLLMQQERLKFEQEEKIEQSFDIKKFYIIKEALENYNKVYNLEKISAYASKILKLSLKKSINWNDAINEIIQFSQILKEENKSVDINMISNGIEYFQTNYIKYPNNFSLIEEQFIDDFKNISNSYFDENKENIKSGFLFNIIDNEKKNKILYILLNNDLKQNIKIYFAIALEKIEYKINFIFLVNKSFDEQEFVEIAKKAIEENSNIIKEKNKILKINEDIKMICNPENDPSNDIIFNTNLYNKIMNDFSINKLYIQFTHSINEITNNIIKKIDIKHIENIIYEQKKLLEEKLVFLIDEENLKNILDKELNFLDFNIYNSEGNDARKKEIIKNIFENEDKKKENKNIKNLMKLLNYDDIMNIEKISLISVDLYQKIFNISEIDYANIGTNLLKINDQFYLYFNKQKKIIKIEKAEKNQNTPHDKNIWIIKDKSNIKNINKDFNISENIIKKIFLINQQYKEIKNQIKDNNNIKEMKSYSIINENWLNEYERHYKYNDIIVNLNNININNDDYEKYKEYLNNVDFINFNLNIKNIMFEKFPEELKEPHFVVPKLVKYISFRFPNNFNILKTDLLYLLMKEENPKEEYNIDINIETKKDYKIYLGNQLIILVEENSENNIIVYSYKDNKYNPECIFHFIDKETLNEQIQHFQNSKNLKNYTKLLGVDITKNYIQEIKNNTNKIGDFAIIKNILNIESFDFPPLIGLENVGATCYMNATLQSFSNIKILTNYFLEKKEYIEESAKNKNYTLADEFLKVILNLWNLNIDFNKRYYAPNDFKKRIGEKNELFKGIAANDAKDLILFILEELHNDLNEPNLQINENQNNNNNINPIYSQFNNMNNMPNSDIYLEQKNYNDFITDYESKNNSIIKDIFYNVQESITICKNCGKKLYSFSIINFLVFPLEKIRQFLLNQNQNSPQQFSHVTLENCFQQYISAELLSGLNKLYCNNCSQDSDAISYNVIYRHSKVLIIILNRGQGLEFNVPFAYPKEIEINNFINMNDNKNYENKEKKIVYELISVITHMGGSNMSGHFISCAKSPVNKKWYIYNDAIVYECENPLNIFGNNTTSSIPYVLFYQLKE